LPGIIARLDHLVELGVDAVWLSPFYRSPMADFGYDVADYCDVDPIFGTLADAERLVTEAHARGLKVIVDFVPNHTSDQHPWFLESRSSRDNPKRDWYIWRDSADGPPTNWTSLFGGPAWTHDPATDSWYLHLFLEQQPDLNWRNPEVQQAMLDALRFWMDRGVDGFRVDVIWLMIKDDQFRGNPPNPAQDPANPHSPALLPLYSANRPEVHEIVRLMRRTLDEYEERVLIGEIYLEFPELVRYYGEDLDGCHLPFNFSLILNRWDAATVHRLVTEYEEALPPGGWPNWVLGNHDQSRLATRIGDAQARNAAMLLLTLRGTPTIYYGEELGMRDVEIPTERQVDPAGKVIPGMNRDPERTPMQWEPGPGAGFTTGEPWLPIGPDVEQVNVATQRDDPGSMYTLYRRLLTLRRQEPALSRGDYERLWLTNDVLAWIRTDGTHRFLVAINFAAAPATVDIGARQNGRVVLGTDERRSRIDVVGQLDLAPNEGVIVRLS
jgi:alpha-glucosidase